MPVAGCGQPLAKIKILILIKKFLPVMVGIKVVNVLVGSPGNVVSRTFKLEVKFNVPHCLKNYKQILKNNII